ncbi:hypothetical protein [Spiroplasma endosymbiont of Acasis viretata]|uniref:hypothetical protein n=1 Tax=Spiroplasma endosymbiont of Acasis viretata TaxID=3066306 RepID=UPI00313B0063
MASGNKQNNNFDARKYMISSLAKGTKINNKSYQKLLSYGIVRTCLKSFRK